MKQETSSMREKSKTREEILCQEWIKIFKENCDFLAKNVISGNVVIKKCLKSGKNVKLCKLWFPDCEKERVGYHMDQPIFVSVPGH